MKTIALLYHDIVPEGQFALSGFQSPDADIYKLDCGEFEKHLQRIAQVLTVAPAGASEIMTAARFRLLLTFDDGGVSAALHTAGLLERFGWRGYFFVTADRVNTAGFLSDTQIRDLHARGHIIGSHSCSHPPRMSHCSREQLDSEWTVSVGRLQQIVGAPVTTASVPGGYYSHEVAASAANAGILTLFNSEPVTSVHQVQGCTVFGRFSVQQGVAADWVAAVVAGQTAPRIQRYLFWNAKKVLKTIGGEAWLRMRRKVLARQTNNDQ